MPALSANPRQLAEIEFLPNSRVETVLEAPHCFLSKVQLDTTKREHIDKIELMDEDLCVHITGSYVKENVAIQDCKFWLSTSSVSTYDGERKWIQMPIIHCQRNGSG